MLTPFDYRAPDSVSEASELLIEHGPRARLMAGGTWLLLQLERRRIHPTAMINLKGVPGLDSIEALETERIRLGALTRLSEVESSPLIRETVPVLADAASKMATPQVRNLGTVGGNVCSGIPSADLAVVLLVLGGEAVVEGPEGRRKIDFGDLYRPWGALELAAGEILVGLEIDTRATASYRRFSVREAVDVVLANAAVAIASQDGGIGSARIALGSSGPIPRRATESEALMAGQKPSRKLFAEAARLAAERARLPDDLRASRRYRRKVMEALIVDALEEAAEQEGLRL